MKNKILLLLVLILISGFSSIAQFKFGITAGTQLSNVRISTYNTDSRLAFNLGLAAITKLTEDIHLQFQLLATAKGYKFTDDYGYKSTVKPLYLELPVVFRFQFETGENTDVYVGTGGYYAFGVGGKQTYYQNGVRETQKLKYDESEGGLRRSDFGMVFQLGAQFRENYEGHFFYDLGLYNILPNSTSNNFNRVFGFNLTWYFNSNKQ